MAHPFQVFQHSAVGEMAIIVAVMAQAWEDLDGPQKLASHAAVYFLSGLYRHHLAWLGLPEEWLPRTDWWCRCVRTRSHPWLGCWLPWAMTFGCGRLVGGFFRRCK